MGGEQSRDVPRDSTPSYSYGQGSYEQEPPIAYPYHGYEPEPPVTQPYPVHTSYSDPSTAHSSAAPPPPGYPAPGLAAHDNYSRFQRRYSRIDDNFDTLEEVSNALAKAGLESSNLIVGIDFTKSNEWTGKISFQRRSLHHIGDFQNPYEQAISIIGKTLASFDEDNLIPCFGFGDASTHDQDVFSFYPNGQPCRGFEDVLHQYRKLVPRVRLSGPTSFAPIIEMAMTIVEESGGQYHVLLIIADGQVTRSADLGLGQLSIQEQRTYDAIVQASHYPLSIVLVGVGDGPWDTMKQFDDNMPSRIFDNFQFVNFTSIMSKNVSKSRKETEFALAALMEVPLQYKATIEIGLLGHPTGKSPGKFPLPPPGGIYDSTSSGPSTYPISSFKESGTPLHLSAPTPVTAPSASSTTPDNQVCPICLINNRDMALGCGHQTCRVCGQLVENCPICRRPIDTRIRLY